MIPLSSCRDIVSKEIRHLTHEKETQIELSLNQILSKTVSSPINYPSRRRSMMDGYAVHHSVEPGTYKIIEHIDAGIIPQKSILKNEVSYIATGALLPDGATTVIKIEDTELEGKNGENVKIHVKGAENRFVRLPGCDIKKGQVLKTKGSRVEVADIGVFATCGIEKIWVFDSIQRLKVGVLSTGNEIVDYRSKMNEKEMKVRDCNRVMLMFELEKMGFERASIFDFGILGDDRNELKKKICEYLESVDMLITTGGISMGKKDYIRPILKEIGSVHFEKVEVKPGKPFTFATIEKGNEKKFVFALPGNPVSCLTLLKLVMCPCFLEISGIEDPINDLFTKIRVKLLESVKREKDRDLYVRATTYFRGEEFVGVSTGNQNSSRLLSLQNSNSFLVVPKGNDVLYAGTFVEGLLYDRFDIFPKDLKIENKYIRSCGCDLHKEEKEVNEKEVQPFVIDVGILTVSDRAFKGIYSDLSGPKIKKLLHDSMHNSKRIKWNCKEYTIVPDEMEQIEKVLMDWSDNKALNLVLTTGGTGFSKRDVTPEATKNVIDRDAGGIIFGIQSQCMKKVPMVILSRATAGIRKSTLIINLPGSVKAVTENIEYLLKCKISHGIKILSTQ